MKRHILVILIFILAFFDVKAQDPVFSQYYSAPLQLNPAFAGVGYAPNFVANYRNQWPSLNAYQTYAVSYDQFVSPLNSGFGLMVLTDDAGQGLIKTNKASGFFAYRVQVNNDLFIKIGAEVGLVQTRYDWTKFEFLDQIDPILGKTSPGGIPFPTEEVPPADPTNVYFDASAGMLVYNKTFYGGFSVKHLNTPNETILFVNDNLSGGLPIRYSFHGGAQIQLVEGNKRRPSAFISPNIMYVRQGDFGQTNVGAYVSYGAVFAGAWFRHARTTSDAAIALIGVEQGVFKIGYSYDFTVSNLNNVSGGTGGSHEISLRVKLREPRESINDCFRLFR